MRKRPSFLSPILVGFFLGTVLTAQVTRNHDVALKNWPAPLYWQPSEAESEAERGKLDSAIRPPSPEAATPVSSLVFVAMTPCRVVDTRVGLGFIGAFGPPSLIGGLPVRTIPIQSGTTCSIPSIAQAYSFNVTVVPQGTLGFLTLYPATAGAQPPPPNVSTLNSLQGTVVANAAIVPAGTDGHGGVDVYASNPTDLIIDVNGYYAPSTGITLAQGTASAPSLSFSGDAGTGIFSSGAGSLSLTTGGTAALTVDSTGDVELAGSLRKGGTLFLHNVETNNLGVGLGALAANTTGSRNTAIGSGALGNGTTGDDNSACGDAALLNNTSGGSNTATGSFALWLNAAGSYNSASGTSALLNNTDGSNNTANGTDALRHNTTGNNNIAVGYQAGYNITTGSNNIDIGNQGMSTDGTSANTGVIRIGTAGTQTSFFAAGIANATVSGAAVLVNTSTGQLGIVSSSRRYKEDIEDLGDDSSGLLRLRPVKFRYRKPYADGSKPIDYGLIAEEVAEVYPELVVKNKDGQVETVQYHKLVPMLLNELQKMQARLAALEKAQ